MAKVLRSATTLAALWQCQGCSHTNNSAKNKRRCFSYRAWRDGIVPLSMWNDAFNEAAPTVVVTGCGTSSFCSNENNAPNNSPPGKVGSPTKSGEKRQFPLKTWVAQCCVCPHRHCHGLSDQRAASHPSHQQSVVASMTASLGRHSTFAAKSMHHTANWLQQWAREPDLRVKSFAISILLTSQCICLLYQGVLLDRISNPGEEFVFRDKSCSRNFSNRKCCSHCAPKINTVSRKIRHSIEPTVQCDGMRARITKKSRNPDMAAIEIPRTPEENKHLPCQLACFVLLKAI